MQAKRFKKEMFTTEASINSPVGKSPDCYVMHAEDLPHAIPGRTIVYCLKQWSGMHLPHPFCKVISLGKGVCYVKRSFLRTGNTTLCKDLQL